MSESRTSYNTREHEDEARIEGPITCAPTLILNIGWVSGEWTAEMAPQRHVIGGLRLRRVACWGRP